MLAPLLRTASGSTNKHIGRHLCSRDFNHTASSTYQSNLVSLLSLLVVSDVTASGSLANGVGSGPDRVYGTVVCRGDVDAGTCRRCLENAKDVVLRECPRRKQAVVWYDYCQLQYADAWSFPNISEARSGYLYWTDYTNVSTADLSLFKVQAGTMMSRLITYATSNSPSGRMFATGEAAFTKAKSKIYGLVQCTKDQSAKDCEDCLTAFLSPAYVATWSIGLRGARKLGTKCWFWYELYPFYNGSAMVSIPLPLGAPAPLPPSDPPTSSKENTRQRGKRSTIIIVVVVVGVALGLISAVTCISVWRMKASNRPHDIGRILHQRSRPFTLATLKAATNNFSNSNKVGEGGFGVVYKGILAGGQVVAVKKLRSTQGLEELRNEVKLLSKQEHRNLVRLLGASVEEEENLLVYEYVPNKSLDNFLFGPPQRDQLNWQQRYKIIGGVARGLLYLHEESQYNIIHRDLKAGNILLDANMNPKISDFGISRSSPIDQTHVSTSRIAGTRGYMSPEYAINGQFSKKSDVFSFGVLVLEIVTGRRINSFSDLEGPINLLSYVWEHWTGGAMREVIDPSLGDLYQEIEVARCVQIGLLCVQPAAANRPIMSHVVLMLDSVSTSLEVPQWPAFVPGQSEIGRHPTIVPSASKLSFSELEPR